MERSEERYVFWEELKECTFEGDLRAKGHRANTSVSSWKRIESREGGKSKECLRGRTLPFTETQDAQHAALSNALPFAKKTP